MWQSFRIQWNFSTVHSGFSSLSCDCCWSDFKSCLFTFTSYLDIMLTFYSCYKDYLSVDFPFESYKQVFIEPEMAVSSLSLGASMSIFSSQALFDEKVIDQVGHSLTLIVNECITNCCWIFSHMHLCWIFDGGIDGCLLNVWRVNRWIFMNLIWGHCFKCKRHSKVMERVLFSKLTCLPLINKASSNLLTYVRSSQYHSRW